MSISFAHCRAGCFTGLCIELSDSFLIWIHQTSQGNRPLLRSTVYKAALTVPGSDAEASSTRCGDVVEPSCRSITICHTKSALRFDLPECICAGKTDPETFQYKFDPFERSKGLAQPVFRTKTWTIHTSNSTSKAAFYDFEGLAASHRKGGKSFTKVRAFHVLVYHGASNDVLVAWHSGSHNHWLGTMLTMPSLALSETYMIYRYIY